MVVVGGTTPPLSFLAFTFYTLLRYTVARNSEYEIVAEDLYVGIYEHRGGLVLSSPGNRRVAWRPPRIRYSGKIGWQGSR